MTSCGVLEGRNHMPSLYLPCVGQTKGSGVKASGIIWVSVGHAKISSYPGTHYKTNWMALHHHNKNHG